MIKFDEKKKLFHLSGKNYSYVMYVNDAGYLQSVHIGGKITPDDYLLSDYSTTVAPNKNDWNSGNMLNDMPCEYSAFGRGDYHEPSYISYRKDGYYCGELKYASHKIFDGAPDIKGMPHARRGGQTLAITLKDEISDLEIILNYTVYDEYDVLVRNAVIKNCGKESVNLKRAYSLCFTLPDYGYSLLRLHGRWAAERSPEITEIGHGVTRVDSKRASSSHYFSPFVAVLKDGCGETSGECFGVSLIYSGSFAIVAERFHTGTVRISGGINDFAFDWRLGGGEEFVTPQTALCISESGLGHMSREFADFTRDCLMPAKYAKANRPVVINNWEGTYFNFNSKKLCDMIDAAAGTGIDTFVLDDGWFGKRDDDKSGLGDWYVNTKKLEGGLKPVIDRCKKHGLKFGLWFEPEMVCEDSDLYRSHTDWAIKGNGVEPVRSRNQLVLDFSRKEVVDYIYKTVSSVLRENDISYVKWDMNRNVTEFYSAKLPPDRQGELFHRYILGVYDLAERLTSEFPDVIFEGCAGGGGRFDLGAMYYFPQIWLSDDTDAYERIKIQYGTSIAYPVSAHSCHVSACPNHQTGRITPFGTRALIASLGTTGYELDPTKFTAEEKAEVSKQVASYKEIEDIVLTGDLYRISNPYESNYFCEILVTKDKKRAYAVGERIHGVPCDYNTVLKLDGLDKDKVYYIRELNTKASGATLMNAGLLAPRLPDYGAWCWHLEEVK